MRTLSGEHATCPDVNILLLIRMALDSGHCLQQIACLLFQLGVHELGSSDLDMGISGDLHGYQAHFCAPNALCLRRSCSEACIHPQHMLLNCAHGSPLI